MKEFIAYLGKNSIKVGATVFGVLGAVSVIFPLADLTQSNFPERVQMLVAIAILVVIVALIYTIYAKHKKSKVVYESGKTKITFKYGDLTQIIEDDEEATIVVPINSYLQIVGDEKIISKTSIHRIFYDYLKKNNADINIEKLRKIKKKKMSNADGNPNGKIGDWFLITPDELGFETKKQFLLFEVNEAEDKGGYFGRKLLTKEDYITGLASLIKTISESIDMESQVYMPLIGARNANVAKPRDVMFLLEELLGFYKSKLRHKIDVVITDEDKEQGATIYQLREIRKE